MGAHGPFRDAVSIRVQSLALSRGGRTLFDDLSFAAAPGEYVEVQGRNGAGKTSLLRALAGLLKPERGAITFDNAPEPLLACHYVAHANALKREDTVGGHLRYWADCLGTGGSFDEVVRNFDLGALLALHVRSLSHGQARRLALSRLLIAPRPVWLLDEPAASLDDAVKDTLNVIIREHLEDGGLVIAAVHEPLGPAPDRVVKVGE